MIYLLTAVALTPGGSSTVHIYTQTTHRTTQLTTLVGRLSGIQSQIDHTKINNELTTQKLSPNGKSVGRAPSLWVIPWHLPYNRGKITEEPQSRCIQYIYIYVQYTYPSIQYIYLFTSNAVKMWETSIVLGTVHSDRTVVVLLVPYLTLSVIVSTLSCIVCMLLWANLTLWHMSTICSPFSSCLIKSHLSSWIALDDVDPTFSLILVTKPIPLKEELHHPCDYITNVIILYAWLMAWKWCHFLVASNTRQEQPRIMYAKSC
jgi:hypothetical protein